MNFPQIIIQLMTITCQNYIPIKQRIFICFLISSILFLLLPLLVYCLSEYPAFLVSMGIMVCFGVCMALLHSSIVGLAGILPVRYMQAYMLGISLNAVGPLLMRVVTLGMFGVMDEVRYFWGAVVFFWANGVVMGGCAHGARVLIRQNVIIFNMAQLVASMGTEDERKRAVRNGDDDDEYYSNKYLNKLVDANSTRSFNSAVYHCIQSRTHHTLSDVCHTQKLILPESLACFTVYLTTFVCYPGLILQTKLSFIEEDSFQVLMLALYTTADILGRFAINLLPVKGRKVSVVIILAAFMRLGVIYTSLQIGTSQKGVFEQDWFKIINTVIIGFGNGLLGTMLMTLGTYKVSANEAERAGQIMAFHMTLGRGLGSMVSLVGLYNIFKRIQDNLNDIIIM